MLGLPLPKPICGAEVGTWANNTIIKRMPTIARRILAENDFPRAMQARINTLIADIPDQPIRLLTDDGPDVAAWQKQIRPYLGQDWLTPPWFFIETYFYRRIIEAVDYFNSGHDPFAYQKQQGLQTTQSAINMLAERLTSSLDDNDQAQMLAMLLAVDLWGNQADLSLWPVDETADKAHKAQPNHIDLQQAQAYLLADDTARIVTYMQQTTLNRVDMLVDNAGFELVGDLCLIDYLLSRGIAQTASLQLKMHPTFVSDATILDVQQTVSHLQNSDHRATQAWGERLKMHLRNGRLQLHTNPFWTSSQPMWEMPQALHQELSQSQLIISKGDANYRRLLGDRHWPFTTPFADILTYAPAPLVALRTLKSELAVGLEAQRIAQLDRQTADWLVNGRYGVIQFSSPPINHV